MPQPKKITLRDRQFRMAWMKYTILRRIIQRRSQLLHGSHPTSSSILCKLQRICSEMENASLFDLSIIHKREIGY